MSKIKSLANIKKASAHNCRTMPVPNADSNRTHLNRVLIGSGDGERDVSELISRHGLKIRSNSVLAYDGLLTLSPDAFDKIGVEEFQSAALDFLRTEFKGRVTTAYLHLDESTPHIQFYMCPIVKKPSDPIPRLSARDYMTKKKLSGMQRRFYQHMAAKLPGADLSAPRHGSAATHTKISHFYELLNRDRDGLLRDVVSNLQVQLEGVMSQRFDELLRELDSYVEERVKQTNGDIQTQLKEFYKRLRAEALKIKQADREGAIDAAFTFVHDQDIAEMVNSSIRAAVSKNEEKPQRSKQRSLSS